MNVSLAADVQVVPTGYGYTYAGAGIRSLGDSKTDFIRAYHITPWIRFEATTVDTAHPYNSGHMWVPIDDYSTMLSNWTYSLDSRPLSERQKALTGSGMEIGIDIDPEDADRSPGAPRHDGQSDRYGTANPFECREDSRRWWRSSRIGGKLVLFQAEERVIAQGASWIDEIKTLLFMLEEPSELPVSG